MRVDQSYVPCLSDRFVGPRDPFFLLAERAGVLLKGKDKTKSNKHEQGTTVETKRVNWDIAARNMVANMNRQT